MAQERSDEVLLQPDPAHFVVANRIRRATMDLTERVPAGQSATSWTDMVTTQIFPEDGPVRPGSFLQIVARSWIGDCPTLTHGRIETGVNNGYAVSMLLLSCPNSPLTGAPEAALYRVIDGLHRLYVVQYGFRGEMTAERLRKAYDYLATVTLCDGSGRHPCPI